MAARYFKVRHAVSRSDADSTGAERLVNGAVSDDANSKRHADKINIESLPDKIFVTGIVGVDRDRRIADFGFRPCCGDRDGKVGGIPERVQISFFFLINDFFVGNGGLSFRVPIDDSVAAIDEPRVIHALESRSYGKIAFLVQSIGLARPVNRGAHALQLSDNRIMAFAGELFHAF